MSNTGRRLRQRFECANLGAARKEKLGELVEAQGLTGPDLARFVTSDGTGAPVVTDGPFPESKELLAGYRPVDVESPERAIEIAAKVRAHLLVMDGDTEAAIVEYDVAAALTASEPERDYLLLRAARVREQAR
jgi:hypothetical protein